MRRRDGNKKRRVERQEQAKVRQAAFEDAISRFPGSIKADRLA